MKLDGEILSRRATWLAWPLGGAAMSLPFLFDALEPLCFVAIAPWIWALERDRSRPFLRACVGGFTFVALGLSWLHAVSSFAVVATAAYFSLYFGLFAWIVVRARHVLGVPTWIAAPLAYFAGEIVAHHVTLLEVTWLFLGNAAWRAGPIVQVAELGGISLVSAILVLVGGATAEAVRALAASGPRGLLGRSALRPVAAAAGIVAAAALFGAARVRSLDLRPGPRVAMVQGGVPLALRLDEARADEVIATHERLTAAAGSPLDLVAWPESSVNRAIEMDPAVRERLGATARAAGAALIVGGLGINERPPPSNSAFLFDSTGRLVSRSDKRVLVPGAETLPVIERIEIVRKPVMEYLRKTMGFRPYLKAGESAVVMSAENWRYGSLICYDDVVPTPAEELRAAGAQALVTISNETWFGDRELDQHVAMASIRCIETRLPMARATNTGWSCVIDPAGRVREELPRGGADVLVATLPVSATWAVPPFVRRGVEVAVVLAALALVALSLRARGSPS